MEYDDIIVGAGSTGAVLAARLSEDPQRSVLLLEAGPDYSSLEDTPAALQTPTALPEPRHDWGFTATVVGDRQIPYLRGRVIGGSSAINLALALRGMPADYEAWAAAGNPAWSWQQVLPAFRRLEDDPDEAGDFHGTGGPIPISRRSLEGLHPVDAALVAACRELGFAAVHDHNHPDATGVGPWPRNVRHGIRVSTALAYLLPVRQQLNLTIRGQCLVHRVLLEGRRAVGVVVESGGSLQQVYGRRITLCAGAIASPLLLLRSGIGPTQDLTAQGITPVVDLPGVGANLTDHPTAPLFVVPQARLSDLNAVGGLGLRYTTPGSDDLNDMQLYWNVRDATVFPDLAAAVGAGPVLLFRPVLQRPLSRGRVTLGDADPQSPPRIQLNCLDHPEDVRRLGEGLRVAWRLACSPQVRPYVERLALVTEEELASDVALTAYLRQRGATLNHPVGTVRMGPAGDAGAVVDQECRVWGVAGLRVVDASVMPRIPRANTNLTCMMIGERIADWMRSEPALTSQTPQQAQ